MLQTICYNRLQSRESCSCDKNISLLQMQDIRLFGMLPFLFHYQQICHVLSSDARYFAPSTYEKKFLLSSNQPDVDFPCLYHFLSVFCNLQFLLIVFCYAVCLVSVCYILLLYIQLSLLHHKVSVGCWPELETPLHVLTNQTLRESSTAYCLGQNAALKSNTKRNVNLVLLQNP